MSSALYRRRLPSWTRVLLPLIAILFAGLSWSSFELSWGWFYKLGSVAVVLVSLAGVLVAFRARVDLHENRIEIVHGFGRRRIPLETISEVAKKEGAYYLRLESGRTVEIQVPVDREWTQALRKRLKAVR